MVFNKTKFQQKKNEIKETNNPSISSSLNEKKFKENFIL